jgi:uncharacterized membrane protein
MKKYHAVLMYFFLFQLAFSTYVHAQSYYADTSINLDETGLAVIIGQSNHPLLSSQETQALTSKKGSYWLFNLTTKESFSDYFVSIDFPKDVEINYIKAKGTFRITQDQNLKLIVSGSKEPVEIIVQYTNKAQKADYSIYIDAAILLLCIFLFVFMYKKIRNKTKKPKEENKADEEKIRLIRHTLTDVQKQILDILIESKEPISQKQIYHRLKLPKSTLSRNLETMQRKNIITKQSRGMVNVIFLNKEFLK